MGKHKDWAVDLNLDYTGHHGNLRQDWAGASISAARTWDPVTAYIDFSGSYLAVNKLILDNQTEATLRIDYEMNNAYRLFAFTTHGFNDYLNLNYRWTAGLGPWFEAPFFKGGVHALSFAFVFEQEHIKTGKIEDTGRFSVRYLFKLPLDEKTRLDFDWFYVPNMKHFNDFQMYADLKIDTKLVSDWLSLNIGFEIEHDSEPPAGVKLTDISFTTGLSFHMCE
jgi:putative salt-induced outer membrane protein YdiY